VAAHYNDTGFSSYWLHYRLYWHEAKRARSQPETAKDLAICFAIKNPAIQSGASTASVPNKLQTKEDMKPTGETGVDTE